MRRTAPLFLALSVTALALSACAATVVQDPVGLGGGHGITITSPAGLSDVSAPLTVRWTSSGIALPPGDEYAVVLDDSPPGQGQLLRLTVCSDNGLLPPPPGATRSPCRDQRYRVGLTTSSSLMIRCIPDGDDGAALPNGWHVVSVVLLDAQGDRVGSDAATATFHVVGGRGTVASDQYGLSGASEGCA